MNQATLKRPVLIVNTIIVILEIIAFIHDCTVFGLSLFKWYTVDSNQKVKKQPLHIIIWPAVVSLMYGIVCLVLNALNVLEGPYFFLEVRKQPVTTIVMWFAIIAVLCLVLSFAYYRIKWRKK